MDKERRIALNVFLMRNNITYKDIGEKLGITSQGAYSAFQSEYMKEDRRAFLIKLGFPEELLPEARRPKFPGLLHEKA